MVACFQLILSIIFAILFVRDLDFTIQPHEILLIIISGLLSFVFFKFLYTSYKGNSVSISQVIYSFSVFVSTVLGIIIFNESLTINKFIGVGLVVIAVILVSYKSGEKFSKYNLFAFISAIVYGVLTSIDKSLSININVHIYQILNVAVFILFSLIFASKRIFTEIKSVDRVSVRPIMISAVGFTIFNKLTFLAYSVGGEVGKVDAVNNTSLFLIIILEIFVLKDKSNLTKKIIGSILAVTGILILGFLM